MGSNPTRPTIRYSIKLRRVPLGPLTLAAVTPLLADCRVRSRLGSHRAINHGRIGLIAPVLVESWKSSLAVQICGSILPLRPQKSYIFANRPNPVAQEVLSHWGIEMIVSEEEAPERALTDFLQDLVTWL
ncbi:hypothetical protein M3I53_36780 [Paraburkholderia sp. CNPSo 3272]|uniref:hypothetical protein n=1 Tax=Paraburkholderia sp. CNPSo 3272 TaxID=2940931 RepID=UPI0020B89224|nr:hypothetical protein [Paraburkholderia sp. CNPSo 3272]MCP3728581.1 hypothetical protein [Paraburkholderia sp. CNPSo 3272]